MARSPVAQTARFLTELPGFTNVVAGSTAILKMPLGMTYNTISLESMFGAGPSDSDAAAIAANIDEVRFIVDGDAKITLRGSDVNYFNAYYGVPWPDGETNMPHFSRKGARSVVIEDGLGWGTADVSSMTCEVDINAGALNPAIQLSAQRSANRKLGKHICIRRFNASYNGAGGEFTVTPNDGPYQMVASHFESANISKIVTKVNQRTVHEVTLNRAKALALRNNRVVQAGFFPVDFAPRDVYVDNMPLVAGDFRHVLTMTAAEPAMMVLVERMEGHG